MKIHSKFRDYYDCVLKWATDEEPIYIRDPQIIDCKGMFNQFFFPEHWVAYGSIFFCNEFYPFVEINVKILKEQ